MKRSAFNKARKNSKDISKVPFGAKVLHQGFLKKMSSGVIKRWQKRYFAIKGHFLMYYENEKMDEKNVKGTIDLEGLTHAGLTSLKGEIQLIISNDTLMLHADSNEDAQKWVDVLKTQCPEEEAEQIAELPDQDDIVQKTEEAASDGSERPLNVSSLTAKGLKNVRTDGVNAMVIVSAVPTTKDPKGTGTQQFQICSSCYSNEAPGSMKELFWEDDVMLPGISSKVAVYFTVVDWSPEGGELTLLGQNKIVFKNEKDWQGKIEKKVKSKLKLGAMEYKPKDGFGKELAITVNPKKSYVGGELQVGLKAYPEELYLCGNVLKTGGDRYSSVWKSRWVSLIDGRLYYYDCFGEPRPKAVIDLAQAKTIVHPDNVLEMVSIEVPDRTWQFKTTVTRNPTKNQLLGGEWLYKLKQAANMDNSEEDKKAVPLSDTEYANIQARRYVNSY